MTGYMTNHWAVLIGINFYAGKSRTLNGCVRDVERVEQYLQSSTVPVNIQKFTASSPQDPSSSLPPEEKRTWPTFENITGGLAMVTKEAVSGDFVYIHFSGHGTRRKPLSQTYGNHETGDLALVLFDSIFGESYLPGLKLAEKIKTMVDKGLQVSLVLDCCFAGSVVRKGSPYPDQIRTTDYNPYIDETHAKMLSADAGYKASPLIHRDVRVSDKWLLDPSGYTILTACGPHEIAKEFKLANDEYTGALTHFLLHALGNLRQCGVEVSHKSLYQYLSVRFHAEYPIQSPLRYGNKGLSFFSELQSDLDLRSILVFWKDGKLYLQAGQAQGVCSGDEYGLFPFSSVEDTRAIGLTASVKAEADTVGGLSSTLKILDLTSGPAEVETGWIAKPVRCISAKEVPVKVLPRIHNTKEWARAARDRPFLNLIAEDEETRPCLFNVTLNECGEHEILDQSCRRIKTIPLVPSTVRDPMGSVINLLEHIVRYKMVEAIDNRFPNPLFVSSVNISAYHPDGHNITENGVFNVKDGKEICIRVENTGTEAVYVHILALESSWQVQNVLSSGNGEPYRVIPQKDDIKGFSGDMVLKLRMKVPLHFEEIGLHQCEDIFKVFITSRPLSFTAFEMGAIPMSVEEFNPPRGSSEQILTIIDELDTYSSHGMRGLYGDGEWIVRNLIIVTSLESKTCDA